MIDIDVIVQNIEAKIKSLEQLTFDDEPNNFLYTPIKAITITSTTDFKQLECQKFVRCNQKITKNNLNENKKIINRRNSASNQESENLEVKQSCSRFSRSYTEFLSTLNADMQKFKEQQMKNQDCDNFLGKNAKIFVQNENEEGKSLDVKNFRTNGNDCEKSTKNPTEKLKFSENLKAALQMSKIHSQELRNCELVAKKQKPDPKNSPKQQGTLNENKKFGKIIKNPNPSTFKPKSETRIVGKIMSRRMTIEGGWKVQSPQFKHQNSDKNLNVSKSTNNELSGSKSFNSITGHNTVDKVSNQQGANFKVPLNAGSTKQIIHRRMSVGLGTKNEITKNLENLKYLNSGQKFSKSSNLAENIGMNFRHVETVNRKSGNFVHKFVRENESCSQKFENSGRNINTSSDNSEGHVHQQEKFVQMNKNTRPKTGQIAHKTENGQKIIGNAVSKSYGIKFNTNATIELTNSNKNCRKSEFPSETSNNSQKNEMIGHDNDKIGVVNTSIAIKSYNSCEASTTSPNSNSPNSQSKITSESTINSENSNQRVGKRKRQMNSKYNESEYMLKNTSREFTNAIRSKLILNKQQKIPGRKQSGRLEQFTEWSEEQMSIKSENLDVNSMIKMENIKSESTVGNVIDFPSTSKSIPSQQPYNRPVSNEIRCKICSKVFSKSFSLNRHMLLHSGERRFSCPHCNYKFLQKSDLHRHMNVHKRTQEFACTRCDKKFQTQNSLRSHLMQHDGVCDKCDVKFQSEKILRYHIMAHHRDRNYECGYCGEKFPLKDFLMSHIKTHVYDEEETSRFDDDDDGIEEQLFLMENPKIDNGSSSTMVLRE